MVYQNITNSTKNVLTQDWYGSLIILGLQPSFLPLNSPFCFLTSLLLGLLPQTCPLHLCQPLVQLVFIHFLDYLWGRHVNLIRANMYLLEPKFGANLCASSNYLKCLNSYVSSTHSVDGQHVSLQTDQCFLITELYF